MLERGLVQIYTGDGKGKTTAALGLAVRAAGQGNRILIYQFLKPAKLKTGERAAMQKLSPQITIEALDANWDLCADKSDEKAVLDTKLKIKDALVKISSLAEGRNYDLIILDEIVYCLSKGLADIEDIRNIVEKKDDKVEIVMTGRGAKKELVALADLVTEMRKVKHPFDRGIKARRGIEY